MVSRKNPGKDLNFTLYNKPSAKFDNKIYACCKEDFEFKWRITNKYLDLQRAATTPYKDLALICFRWRYQKNKNHGEKIEFQTTPGNTDYCPCYAGHQIAQRFVCLKAPRNTLLAIYRKNKRSAKYSYLIKAGVEKNYKSPPGKFIT